MNIKQFRKINSETKIKLIFALSIISFIIFIADYIINNYAKIDTSDKDNFKSELLSIDLGIDNLLDNYGIKKEWRTKQSYQVTKDLVRFERQVRLPYNFPLVELNKEISVLCEKYKANITSREDIKNQIVNLKIFSNGIVIHSIKFITDPSIIRNSGNIVLIVKNINELNDLQKLLILKEPYFQTFLVSYTKKNTELIKEISNISKECLLDLTIKEKIDDEEYDTSLEMDSIQVKKKLRQIIRNYEGIKGFLVSYEKYDEDFNKSFTKEVTKLGKKALLKSKVKQVNYDNTISLNFQKVLDEASSKGLSFCLIEINKNNIDILFEELKRIKKLGYKYISLSEAYK